MNKICLSLLLSLTAISMWAQSAMGIVESVAKLLRSNSVKISFVATTFNGSKESGSTNGTLQYQGNRFKVNTNDFTIWFDGKNQWTLLNGSDEVNLSQPSNEDVQRINPYSFINIYKNGYQATMRSITYNQQNCTELTLQATQSNLFYQRIYLIVDNKNTLLNVRTKDLKGNWMRFRINSIQQTKIHSNSVFTFNKSQYPNVEVIDLR